MVPVIMCGRCNKTSPIMAAHDWNVDVRQGVIVQHLCPACQSPEENAEAEINLATTTYGRDAFGRLIGSPKVVA